MLTFPNLALPNAKDLRTFKTFFLFHVFYCFTPGKAIMTLEHTVGVQGVKENAKTIVRRSKKKKKKTTKEQE